MLSVLIRTRSDVTCTSNVPQLPIVGQPGETPPTVQIEIDHIWQLETVLCLPHSHACDLKILCHEVLKRIVVSCSRQVQGPLKCTLD